MAFSSGSTLQQTDEVAAVAPSSSGGGGGGGVSDWDDLTGELSGPVPFDTSGPSAAGPKFVGAGEDVEWRRDPSNDIALEVRDTTNGNRLLWLDDNGRLHTRRDQEAFADGGGSSTSGVNSLLQVEDAGTVLTTDAASIDFTGSGVNVSVNGDDVTVDVSGGSGSDIDIEENQSVVVGGATGLSFEGSGIDSVDKDGDGTATVNISKGSSTEVQEGGTAQVSDVTVLDFVGGDFSVANPTSGEAELSLQDDTVTVAGNSVSLGNSTAINHGDLSSIGSSDHHTRPSAGDGLSDSSNTFSVNESQVDHDSLNQYVANEHVDHSAVTISAGTALSGGGDLTASRTLDVTGPFTGIPFKTSGDNLEWQADANNDLILQNTTDSQTLLKVDQDTGTVFAAGDVVAFGLSGGGGSGSTSGLQADAPLTLDTTTDPDTIGLSVGSGLTVTNGTLEADGSVGVSSVFGRTGDVTASSGDYSASQISGFDSAAVSAVENKNPITLTALEINDGPQTWVLDDPGDDGELEVRLFGTGGTEFNFRADGSDYTTSKLLIHGNTVWHDGNATSKARSAVRKQDVGLGNVPNVNPRSEMRNLGLSNQEMDNSWVGGQGGGQVGYDASVGLFLDYGSSGGGITKDVYPVLDVGNTKTGSNVNVTYNGINTRPKISLSQGSGSGLDADTVDGYEGNDLAVLAENETFTNGLNITGGNVGIGTTSPQRKLHIDGGGAADIRMRNNNDSDYWELNTRNGGRFDINRGGNDYLSVDSSGNVGIGTTSPSYALEVSGDARSTGEVEAFLGSDRRLKTDLDPLDSALDKIDKLTGYNFDWRNNDSVMPHKRGNTDIGVIAQEVEQVLPNAVKEFEDGHSKGYKSVSYDKLVPLLIEAIKDLRSQVNQLQ